MRAVVVDRGVRAATIAAVRDVSGASTGSIYHRFGSSTRSLPAPG
ncbi:MAG: TetR family transcriptional regulator [Nocardioidaceae bacterium]